MQGTSAAQVLTSFTLCCSCVRLAVCAIWLLGCIRSDRSTASDADVTRTCFKHPPAGDGFCARPGSIKIRINVVLAEEL